MTWCRIINPFISGLFLSLFLIAKAQATTVYVAEIEGLFHKDKSGAYDQVIAEAIKRIQVNLTTTSVPPTRGRYLFKHEKRDCFSPANKAEYQDNPNILVSIPFNKAAVLIFSLPGTQPISSLKELQGKKLAKVRGLRIDPLNSIKDLLIYETKDNDTLLRLLRHGRVDAFAAYAPDIIYTLNKQYKKQVVEYQSSFRLLTTNNAIVCYNTPENLIFLNQFNQAINSMKSDGTLQSILGTLYLN